jgi:hypothetical protein
MNDFIPSIFESFNARSLAPEQVAKTFIPPKAFLELIKRNHSILLGPRGSGKTTLLKMLQVPALRSWNHENSNDYINQVEFTGIFVPADVAWGAQIDNLIAKNTINESIINLVKNSAFTSHILLSFIDSIRVRTEGGKNEFKHISLTKNDEANIVKSLSDVWGIDISFPTLLNLRLSIRKRLILLSELSSKMTILSKAKLEMILEDNDYLYQDFQTLISSGIDIVNDYINKPYEKWALLFDEMELAPALIRKNIITSLRSTDSRIILKLSISPYSNDSELFIKDSSAMSGQDFSLIKLWNSNQNDCLEFSSKLVSNMLTEKGAQNRDISEVLGKSNFEQKEEKIAERYKKGSYKYNLIKELSEIDKSFNDYLRKYKIDINSIDKMSENDRAQYIRKITSIVPIRLEYRKKNVEGLDNILRSRKSYKLYTKFPNILLFTEGNPRWLIGLLTNLLECYVFPYKPIEYSKQNSEIEKVINRYRALLRTIPISYELYQKRGLLLFLDKLGEYFTKKLLIDDFNPEPPLSFIVDPTVSPDILEAIGKALNAGALVFVPEGENDEILTTFKGKRFRLSYMLAPFYKMPLITGRCISLSSILKNSSSTEDEPLFYGEKHGI